MEIFLLIIFSPIILAMIWLVWAIVGIAIGTLLGMACVTVRDAAHSLKVKVLSLENYFYD